MRSPFLALIPAAMALVLCGCAGASAGSASPRPTTLSVTGSVSVPGLSKTATEGEECAALSNYDDVSSGGQVVISDSSGATVALTTLDDGVMTQPNHMCKFTFSAEKVPASSKFYGVHVGNAARGVVQYSKADLSDPVEITIGG